MVHFIRGRHKLWNPQCHFCRFSCCSSRWKRHMAHRVNGISISSNKRNKSVGRRNKPSWQNTHKEAWTGKSSISTSWEIITPFWMCLWGQRGLCYDACTIYWRRSMQCSWSEPWTPAKGHAWSDTVLLFLTDMISVLCHRDECIYSLLKGEGKIITVSQCVNKPKAPCTVSLYSYSFVTVGVHIYLVQIQREREREMKEAGIVVARVYICLSWANISW